MRHKLFWFVDSEKNARNWNDFGSRTNNAPNRGYLAIAFEALKRTQGDDFEIIPLIGRSEVLQYIPNAPKQAIDLPPAIWRSFVISQLCSTHGGLVIDGNSVLTVGQRLYPLVSMHRATMFGTDPDEPVVSPTTAIAPGPCPYLGWASAPNTPSWLFVANEWTKLVDAGPQTWSSAIARRMGRALWEGQVARGAVVIRQGDGSRFPNGTLRQLEDYFGRLDDATDPKLILSPDTAYITYNGDDLSRKFEWNWVLRLSVDQLKSSNLLWMHYATK